MSTQWILFATIFGAGMCVGSFINLAAWRLPAMLGLIEDEMPRGDLASPRSYCPACRAPIARRHLVPIAGFVALGGKCEKCREKIGIRYPAIEIAGGALAVLSLVIFGWTIAAFAAAIFGFCLLLLAAIDSDTGYLPDAVTLPLAAGGLIANTFGLFAAPADAIAGALAGYSVFRAIELAFRAVRKKDGLGQGDAKLLCAIGAWGGWALLPSAVLIGTLATLVYLAARSIAGRPISPGELVPFGPGLCLGGSVALFGSAALAAGI